MKIFLLFILLFYVLNILWLWLGVLKYKQKIYTNSIEKTTFSVIVPFKNEAENLPVLLESISKLKYPKHLFEVILVDDDSEDQFELKKYNFSVQVLKMKTYLGSPKKNAITLAIQSAKNEWIITSDADCVLPDSIFQQLNSFINEKKPKMVAMPVEIIKEKGFLSFFQAIDFYSLQQTTLGSFVNQQAFMCNGANFAYQKQFFNELNGFQGNEKITSGDDVFLLQKAIQKEKESVFYLKNNLVVVQTKPLSNWNQFLQQRVRWASKTNNYNTFYPKLLAVSVFFGNFGFVLALLYGIFFKDFNMATIYVFVKFAIDSIFLYPKLVSKYYFLSFFSYPLSLQKLYCFLFKKIIVGKGENIFIFKK